MFDVTRPQARPQHLCWSYKALRPGQSVKAWKAGPLIGTTIHYTRVSKPCRRAMSAGALPCVLCDQGLRTRYLGYLPLVDPRGSKIVVCVSTTVAPYVDDYAVPTFLEAWRTDGQRDPLKFRPLVGAECPRTPERVKELSKRPADIRPWLLELWQDLELVKWSIENYVPQALDVSSGSTKPSVNYQTQEATESSEIFESLVDRFRRRGENGQASEERS